MKTLTACFCSMITIAVLLAPASAAGGARRLERPAPRTGGVGASQRHSPESAPAPQIGSTQLFFAGELVSQLIVGTKAKRYSIKIIGQGFDPSAKAVVDGMKTRVTFASSAELDVVLKGGILMLPGEMHLQVVNGDGQTSNAVILEVVSDPRILSIATISPDFGPLGTQITVTGVGFTPRGNHIRFFSGATDQVGVTSEVDSSDGRTITFSLPDFLCPPCSFSVPPCGPPCFALNPGQYDVFVINDNGMSNSLRVLVSSPTGPIGVWGEQGVALEVTDTQVTISGLCFVGQIPQTLTTDSMGNFNLTGTVTPMIGPVGQGRPATYQGTISGKVMTLTITMTEGPSTLGPFTLTFGDEVHVVHPCV